ncbi:hypothetical protein [Clostridium sp.]
MRKKIDLKRFLIITIISFVLLTSLSIQWIPFNYPTALLHIVVYWQIRDQLFINHQYFFAFIFVSVILGILFSVRLKGIFRKIQEISFYSLLFIWTWIMYFESSVG